jgi:integrase/recombinase XerD
MKNNNYSVNIHFDKRFPKKGTQLCPIQLGLSISGEQFKCGLKMYATQEEFTKAISGRGGSLDTKELRRQLSDYKDKAEKLLGRLPNPTKDTFLRLFRSETDLFVSNKTDAACLFQDYINECQEDGRIKTGQNMEWTLKSLKSFRSKLFLEDIDHAWLNSYKYFMLKNNRSQTTVQIYLRNLRTIFNRAIKSGLISEKHYPFKHFVIGSSVKSKAVLYAPDLKKLWEYQGTTLREKRAHAYWLFSYLGSGLNYKDLCYLKFKDIKGDTLTFVREKTKRTNPVANKQISVYIHDEMRNIIDTWGNKPGNPEDYIFPILNGMKSPADKEKRRMKMQRQMNDKLKAIGVKLGFEEKLVLNLARHSFATHLLISQIPVSHISSSLGHSSQKTTEHYLKSLPSSTARDISNTLLNFNEPKL